MSHKGGALVDRVDWLWGVIHGYTICLGLLYKLGQLSNQYFMRWEREKPRDLRYPRSLGSPGTLLLETPTHTYGFPSENGSFPSPRLFAKSRN